ncbi:MAG TPA: hypothetical protein DCY13_21400, partial [Verrucomicrobiales bacterium]|nr:hypothetical protein [Verrucomicrobiales bacterium]
GSLTVGVIPPAVDQVLIGAVDRSRNPDLKLALVLGLNEGVFPRPVDDVSLFTEGERTTLEATPLRLPGDRRLRLGHERYLGYIACTRARERLVLTWSENDAGGNPLNPSAFVDQVRRMFPFLTGTRMEPAIGLSECVHPVEVLTPLLRADLRTRTEIHRLRGELLEVDDWLRRFDGYRGMLRQERLGADAILKLFGTRLRTSASRLEEYAACPFKFFVTAGLRARERGRFEVDARKTGTFMHEVLRQFHVELARERKLWRSLALDEARERIARIAGEQQGLVAGGVLAAHPRSRFAAAAQTRLLQDFVVATIEWMTAYRFDPIAVELSLGGEDADLPWWEIDLGDDRKLAFRGSVDRVDAAPVPGREGEVCLNVLDYKSGQKKFDELKMQAGLQLQLPAYLAALCAVADRSDLLGGRRAVPTGMFYVRLKGPSSGAQERDEPDSEVRGFEHTGRFSFEFLPLFDARAGEGGSGQFNYRLKKDGQPHGNSRELVPQTRVERMIEEAGVMLRHMGREILGGRIAVDPYRKGSELPCTWCSYGSICRIDRWTHAYRPLRPLLTEADAG